MRRGILALALGLSSCATGIGRKAELAPLWKPVVATADADKLRIDPLNSAAHMGDPARLHVATTLSSPVSCTTADGETLFGEGDALVVPAPALPSPVEVVCKAGDAQARAQVTFT